MQQVALDILEYPGILSSSIHVGNSDVVGEFVYKNSKQLVDLISKVKKMDDVDRSLWSEEVFVFEGKKESFRAIFKNLIRTAKKDRVRISKLNYAV